MHKCIFREAILASKTKIPVLESFLSVLKGFLGKIVPKKKNNLCIVRFIVHIKCYNETTKGKHNLERKGDNKNDKRYKRDQKRERRT